jgi:tetratricopeptide (TPR) repeat protein
VDGSEHRVQGIRALARAAGLTDITCKSSVTLAYFGGNSQTRMLWATRTLAHLMGVVVILVATQSPFRACGRLSETRRRIMKMKPLALCSLAATCLVLFNACTLLGMSMSSNPETKLKDAQEMYLYYNRPVRAESLIDEAIVIYKKENDAHGLGKAYREYAQFLESSVVANRAGYFREHGFIDKSVTFDNRFAKAKEYYGKSLESHQVAAKELATKKQYDLLTNTFYNMAVVHLALDQRNEACADYDHALEAYKQNMKQDPFAKPSYSHGYASLPDALEDAKRRAGCPGPAPNSSVS